MRRFFWSREAEADSALPPKPEGPILLAERMAQGPLPMAQALHYAIATAEALREVHARGRVHALLQPPGIAIRGEWVQFVPTGAVAITPYFSPEQVMGRELDLRSDIFSLGAILYEMLSGSKAFPAISKPALRFAILDGEPAPLQNVPRALSQLVMRCLEKKPERRVQRLEILLAQLKLQEILTAQAQRAAAAAGE
jgi:serine/threonine-protein kinase